MSTDNFLPLMTHPVQVSCAVADNLPSVTVWDNVNIYDGHDVATRNKRQFFDSVQAETKQIRAHKLGALLDTNTGEYPQRCELYSDDYEWEITVNFRRQPLPVA